MLDLSAAGIFLGKTAAAFVMPLGLTMMLMAAAITQSLRDRSKSARLFMIAALIVLAFASNPMIATFAIATVERQYPPIAIEDLPKADAAILLGGALRELKPPRRVVEFESGGNRVMQAARLYRAGKVSKIIATGGDLTKSDASIVEADLMRLLLIEWGVPDTAIITERKSRTTYENAIYTRDIWTREAFKTGLLVTSASHMPRALATFRRVGLDLSPASVDVHAAETEAHTLYDLIPSGDAVRVTSYAAREWIGRLGYTLLGRGG